MRSLQLKNKITDTSLFAELVKHRHKHESEIKSLETLLEKKTETITEPAVIDQVDSKAEVKEHHSPMAMDIDDIPIPSDNKIEENQVKLNEISLPNNVPPPEQTNSISLPASLPQQNAVDTKNSLVNSVVDATVKQNMEKMKSKSITKLPMPPGINQTDLEEIESPPSRSPSPQPPVAVKPKTPPRKGIMNLPMPPGKCVLFVD